MILGIDFGSSSTDAVLIERKKILKKISFTPPISAKKLESELKKRNWPVKKIKKIGITGGKKSFYPKKFLGLKIKTINEINAIAFGGFFISGKKTCLVISLGTGTAIVSKSFKIKHVSGTGVGGGTLIGLSQLLLKTKNLTKIQQLSKTGNLKKIDLLVKDVVGTNIKSLNQNLTASNFAKLKSKKKSDIAFALINLIAETNGIIISLSALNAKQKNIVITGKLPLLKQFKKRLVFTTKLYGFNPLFPKNFEFATALGAAFLAEKAFK